MNNLVLPPKAACGGCTLICSSSLNTHMQTDAPLHSAFFFLHIINNTGDRTMGAHTCKNTLNSHTFRVLGYQWNKNISTIFSLKNFVSQNLFQDLSRTVATDYCGRKASLHSSTVAAQLFILAVSGFGLVCVWESVDMLPQRFGWCFLASSVSNNAR